jgi:hypothetical protein
MEGPHKDYGQRRDEGKYGSTWQALPRRTRMSKIFYAVISEPAMLV